MKVKRGRSRHAVKKENGKEEAKNITSSASNSRKDQGKKKINADSEDKKDDSEEEEKEGREEKEMEKHFSESGESRCSAMGH